MHETIHPFLKGGGEMGRLIQDQNWAATALGDINQWSSSLRIQVSLMLKSRFPMLIFWGPELVTFYNDAFRPSLGDDGKHPSSLGQRGEVSWAESWPVIGPMIHGIMAGGDAVWFEDQKLPLYRDGKMGYAYWTYSFSPIIDETEAVAGILVTCAETTKAVESLQQLAQSKEQQERAIDAAELGTWDLDPSTGNFVANARLKDWFGLQPDEETPLSLALEVMAEADRDRVAAAINYAMQPESGGIYEEEYTIVHPQTGQQRIVQAKGKARFNENGQATRLNGTLLDITGQVRARRTLENTAKKLNTLIQSAPVAIGLFIGRDLIIETPNETFIEIVGRGPHIVGKSLRDVMPELESQPFLQILDNVFNTGEIFKMPGAKVFLQRNGELVERYFDVTFSPIFDEGGNVISILDVSVDVTTQQTSKFALEAEVAARTAELAQVAKDLAAANTKLREANQQLTHSNEELSQYAYVASHDLQEPLRKIQFFTGMLGQADQDAQQRSGLVERITGSAKRMSLLINDLLSFSRLLNSEKLVRPVDLNVLVRDVVGDFDLVINEKAAQVSVGPLPVMEGVSLQLNQLFSNLLGNALKFSTEGSNPLIEISCREATADEVSAQVTRPLQVRYNFITIADNGIGFDPLYVNQIFEVFKRLHGRSEYSGSGIGLAICRRVVKNHHGAIYADSIPDRGATFFVLLPEKQSDEPAPATPAGFAWNPID